MVMSDRIGAPAALPPVPIGAWVPNLYPFQVQFCRKYLKAEFVANKKHSVSPWRSFAVYENQTKYQHSVSKKIFEC
jgi:hypothetical protein